MDSIYLILYFNFFIRTPSVYNFISNCKPSFSSIWKSVKKLSVFKLHKSEINNDFRVNNNVAYRRYFPGISLNRDYWDATSNQGELPVNQTKFEMIAFRIRKLGHTTNNVTYAFVIKIFLVLNQALL